MSIQLTQSAIATAPESPHTAAEIEAFLAIMELIFHAKLARTKRRTLFLLTADHGQIAIDPATTIYMNQRFQNCCLTLPPTRPGGRSRRRVEPR